MSKADRFCFKIDPIRIGLIGAFLTLLGDFASFLAALTAAQEECQDKSSITNNKTYAENRIKELEYEINKLKREINL